MAKERGREWWNVMMLRCFTDRQSTARWSAGLIGFDLMWPTNITSFPLEREKIEMNTKTSRKRIGI